MPQTRFSLLRAALITATSSILPATAADLYWDANGATPGSGNASGTWDNSFNWTSDPTGSIPQVAWTEGSTAIFSAGTDGTSMTVTVNNSVTVPAIIIEEAGNTVTLAGGTIQIGGGTINSSALGTATDRNVAISATLAGNGGLTLQSHGDFATTNSELDLTGTNTFTGDLVITSGMVGWSSDAAFGALENGITLDGGGLVDTNRNLSLQRDLTVGANGGVLRSYGNANTLLQGDLLGSGTLRKTDLGGITFTRDDYSFTGVLEVQGGSARVGEGSTGSISGFGGITIGGGAVWVRRTDDVNTSSLLPPNITFSAAGSLLEFNPPSQDTVITLDQDIGNSTTTGVLRVSGGSLNLANGTDVSVSTLRLGLQSGTNRGILNIGPGSTITTSFFDLGQTGSGSGTVNQTGGTATVAPGGLGFRLGHWDNGANPGTVYNLSGGTLDASAVVANIGWDGQANMIVGGGSGTATLKAGGILLDANGNSANYSDNLTLTENGRIELGASNLASSSASDRLFFDGGTLAAASGTVVSAASTVNPGTVSTLDANGFILSLGGEIAGTGTLDLIDSSGTGAGAIDFNTGTANRTVNALLTGSAVVTKGGSGKLTLTADNTHTGSFFVSGGILDVAGSLDSSLVDINSASLGGEGSLGGDLEFGYSSPGTLLIDPTTPGALAVAGNVTLTGANTISFTSPFSGTVAGLTYGGTLGGGGTFSLANQSNYRSASVDTSTPGQINVTNANEDLTWTGTGGGIWDLNTTSGWVNGGVNTFYWGDTVLFDESATVKTVTLAGEVAPFGITVDSTTDYTITGSTGNFISGIGSLLKKGSSTLTIGGPNTYTGGTVISSGTIQVRSPGALGTSPVVLGDAATGSSNVALYLDTNRVNFGTQVRVSANGTGTATLGSRASVTGSGDNNQFTNIVLERDVIFDSNAADRTDYENITGTGNITVTGTGRTNFPTTPATWTGDLTLEGPGILQVGVASTAGNRIPDSTDVTINAAGIMNLSTAGETIAGLNGTGTVGTNSPSGGTAVLSLGSGDADGDFSGLLKAGGGNLAITKIGLGTQTITGTNTHTGRTTLTAGTLAIDGEEALGAAPAALAADHLLFNGGTLKAIGSITLDDANRGITTTSPGATFEVDAEETLAISSPMTGAGAVTKTGEGLMTSTGGSWTGVTTVSAGTLRMLAKGNVVSDYVVSPEGTLELAYSRGSNYDTGVVVHGAGTEATTGLYLLGGVNLNFQRNGGLRLSTAPTTIRTYGGGTSILSGFDINTTHLTVDAEASGSVIAADVEVNTGSYGYRANIAAGANTATGDVTIEGPVTGNGSVPRGDLEVNLMKYGTGSLRLNGIGSFPEGVWIREGTLQLGGNDRLAPTAAIVFGDADVSGTFALNGSSQTVSDIAHHNGNTSSRIIGGAAGMSELTINYSGNGRIFSGSIGGSGNEANLALVKSGSGNLVLDGNLAYSGSTTVNDGSLTLATPALDDNSSVSINGTTAVLDLVHGENDTVAMLFFDNAPQAAGTWGSSASGAENTDDTRFSGDGVLTVTGVISDPYASWEVANGIAGAGGGTDSDGDGIANAIEFVLGGDPSGPDSNSNALKPVVTVDATYLNFVFRRTDASMALAPAQQPYVEYGSDLAGWTTAVQGAPVENPVQIVVEDDFFAAGTDRVTVRIPRALATPGTKLFARLRADIP